MSLCQGLVECSAFESLGDTFLVDYVRVFDKVDYETEKYWNIYEKGVWFYGRRNDRELSG